MRGLALCAIALTTPVLVTAASPGIRLSGTVEGGGETLVGEITDVGDAQFDRISFKTSLGASCSGWLRRAMQQEVILGCSDRRSAFIRLWIEGHTYFSQVHLDGRRVILDVPGVHHSPQ